MLTGGAGLVVGSLVGSLFFFEVLRQRWGGSFPNEAYGVGARNCGFASGLRYRMITVFIPAFLSSPILPFKAFARLARGQVGELLASDSCWCCFTAQLP